MVGAVSLHICLEKGHGRYARTLNGSTIQLRPKELCSLWVVSALCNDKKNVYFLLNRLSIQTGLNRSEQEKVGVANVRAWTKSVGELGELTKAPRERQQLFAMSGTKQQQLHQQQTNQKAAPWSKKRIEGDSIQPAKNKQQPDTHAMPMGHGLCCTLLRYTINR